MDAVPYGPRRIGARHQVVVPSELLDAIGARPGDDLWFVLNPDRPGTLVVLSRAQAEEVFTAGWERTRRRLDGAGEG